MRYIALLCLLLAEPSWPGEPIRVAVAANFKATLEKASRQFEAETGLEVQLSSASTGVLASQIKYGAPFDLFFAADRETPEQILAWKPDNPSAGTFCYARGSLVLVGGNRDLKQLADPRQSLAIANPATAPYGRAALQVLIRDEFRAGENRKLVRGNNVVQAYQFWYSGAVDLALVPRALAPAGAAPVPQGWHLPLEQHAVVLTSNPDVGAYLNWIRSDTVRSLITQAGYDPCP